jgi:hypothetical protein
MDVEAQVLEVIQNLQRQGSKLAVGEITEAFISRYGREYERPITNKWMGYIIRRKLHIKTQKSDGVFVIPLVEEGRLKRLYEKYGLMDTSADDQAESGRDVRDVRDVSAEAGSE